MPVLTKETIRLLTVILIKTLLIRRIREEKLFHLVESHIKNLRLQKIPVEGKDQVEKIKTHKRTKTNSIYLIITGLFNLKIQQV